MGRGESHCCRNRLILRLAPFTTPSTSSAPTISNSNSCTCPRWPSCTH